MRIDLEVEYNNRARVPEHPANIAGWARDAAAYREAHPEALRHRIDFGPSNRQFIDVFTPEQPNKGSVPVLFIHGGYWQALDPSFFSHMAKGLNAHGVIVGIAGYDLCPDVTVGEIVAQMRRAAIALAGYVQAAHVVVTGHSAGGHLAAMLAAMDWPAHGQIERFVPAGLAISGLFDLEPLVPTSLNQKIGLTPAEARAQSPRLLHPPKGLVFDCWVGGEESSEYLRQSRTLAAVWAGCGAEMASVEVAGENHFTVIGGLADANDPMTRRLAEISAV